MTVDSNTGERTEEAVFHDTSQINIQVSKRKPATLLYPRNDQNSLTAEWHSDRWDGYLCPNRRSRVGEDGHWLYVGCGRWSCPNVGCREHWSNWQLNFVTYSHTRDPFTHKMLISANHLQAVGDRKRYVRLFLDRLADWRVQNRQ